MKRLAPLFVGMLMLVPAWSAAQTPRQPPVPPPPPPAPSPVPSPLPAPPTPPTPLTTWLAPQIVDRMAIEDAVRAAESGAWQIDDLRMNLGDWQTGQFMTMTGQNSESSAYSSGLSLMSDHKYDEAIVRFDRVIGQKGAHADGALYHKAYCQAKLGQSTEAVATLAELKKSYGTSPYLKDARALEADVRKLGPNEVDDEDIKILAIQSLQNQSPDQAIPLLEGVLNKSTNSLKIKYQALYVLAGIDQPRAHQILLSYAKGGGNPDLQKKAIGYLGSHNQKTTTAELIDIYNSTSDVDLKLSVISAFRTAGAKSPLISIASGAGIGAGAGAGTGSSRTVITSAEPISLRTHAMSGLTELASPQEVWPLYQKEENKDLRLQWVNVFSSMGAVDQLLQIAKTDKDPTVRNRAVRALGGGNLKSDKTGPALVEMYGSGDKDTKSAVIAALGSQNNAESLVAIARKETDPELRRQVVSRLADLAKTSKVAMDYLMEIIK